ncbi:response regulator transcription factor [Ornithinimicrobium ciconiae]|uniref:Response regulator transcription factor n=1 Tax=Ornithinimicrobium ciconiae TaxID=2594265 RepID=A0A516G7X9_9MICO|nr:response regulator transcription factor [Ornithinimicrobium ciconiae]QDO87629.1 response regulator transcription factor [Ornithinimicrobium ciconiae]
MAELALLTPGGAPDASSRLLPSLELLPHRLRTLDLDPGALLSGPPVDLVLVDATSSLVQARALVRTLSTMQVCGAVVAIFDAGGLVALDEQWPISDFVLTGSGPAELAARLRRCLSQAAAARTSSDAEQEASPIRVADVVVDESSWTVRAGGEPLDLTFKEFELLRFLVRHPGRVLTREQLLHEVWGTDYYGGPRTVDVHIRRLRAKLGSERESLIGTIRNVGYRFAGPSRTTPEHGVME